MSNSRESPQINALNHALMNGYENALEDFWRYVERVGSPLVESFEDEKTLLITFLHRASGPGNHVLLLGTPANFDGLNHRLVNLPTTDLWYLSLPLHPELRTIYGILENAPHLPVDFIDHPDFGLLNQFFTAMQNRVLPDAFNPKSHTIPKGIWLNPKEIHLSLLELPQAPAQPWVKKHDAIPQGTLSQFRFRSEVLGNERNVWLYMPPSVEKEEEKHRGVLVIYDGDAYTSIVPTPTILDNLLHAKKIPPLIALFFDNPDDPTRDRELGCNPLMPQFIETELLKTVLDGNNIVYDSSKMVIAGSSFGGLGALYAGFHMPERFKKIISLSGYLGFGAELQREDQWLIGQYAQSETLPLEIYLSVGSLESGPPTFDRKPSFVSANRAMRDVLQTKGYRFHYHEYEGGHDYVCWQQELAKGLIFLFS